MFIQVNFHLYKREKKINLHLFYNLNSLLYLVKTIYKPRIIRSEMKNILFMKNEFVVSKIEASQDEKIPFVYVVFTDTKTLRKGNQQQSPFGGTGMAFNSPEDLMKNLPKMFSSGGGGDLNNSPTFKLSIREYDDSGLRVGDKVTIEIKKSASSGGI